MSNLYTTETHLEYSKNHPNGIIYYETDNNKPQETRYDSVGDLYRNAVEEFGRCTGKIHQDSKSLNKVVDVGWVFVKRVPYNDSKDTYLREVWVTVYEECDESDPRALRNQLGDVLPLRVKYM